MSQASLLVAGRSRSVSALAALALLAAAFSACLSPPSIPIPGPRPPEPSDAPIKPRKPREPHEPVSLIPEAPLDAAPPVLWIRIEKPVDPARIVLVHGRAGSSQVGQVRRNEISRALRAELVPLMIWSEDPQESSEAPGEGATPNGSVVIAPSEALVPGDEYTLVSIEPPRVTSIHVLEADPAPILPRIWPPAGASATSRYAVWCSDVPLPPIDEAVSLAPAGPHGQILRGVIEGDSGERCLRFEAPMDMSEGATRGQPPPSISSGEELVRLDPRPIEGGAPGHPIPPLDCEPEEMPFGPGCALVADDRLTVRAPAAPALWTISGAGVDRVLVTEEGESFTLKGFPPASTATLDVVAVDDGGEIQRSVFTFATLASMPHLLLNEVYANPLGPEPAQEWVEILNDGAQPAELGGYVLIDVGGETILPPGTLPPGGFALIVNQAFLEDDGVDPAPEPGSLVVRVPKLGHSGLSNTGEPLSLRDPSNVVISRSPVGPKTKAGMSLARISPAAPDNQKGSFILGPPTPGRANAP
jgi:hypothetical protein